ncbi:MAG: hypothetical protein FWC83_02225 [Alphaproteobacteria bacterium]|nr:hypothetical protein [Alphaproteobacteria bacterium]
MKHKDIWAAIESFAAERNLSCSALARVSGLDATTFNKSKRWSNVGQERWPSVGSIAKIIAATDASFEDFADHVSRHINGN